MREATAALAVALAIAREGEDQAREGEALKLFGVLAREGERHGEADAHFAAALLIARDMGEPLLAAEVLRERGELRVRQGHLEDAQNDWEEARRGFRSMEATLDADRMTTRIDALLETIRRDEWSRAEVDE
jgi:tetratricopeptide (TPR) repeat protein